jgi:hypothetical protein
MTDPLVSLTNRLNINEDGEPLCESIVTNINDEIAFEIDGNSLVGRCNPERGAAQRINIAAPLELSEQTLKLAGSFVIEITDLKEQLESVNERLEKEIEVLRERLTTLEERIMIIAQITGQVLPEVALVIEPWLEES